MKCPICGQELRPGKKDPNYLLCYNCKKKFKAPAAKVQKEETEEPKYSNIPPKHVREKREKEMRQAYDEMLAADDTKKRKKKDTQAKPRRKEEVYDDVYDEDDDEGMSMAPVIILGIAIVAVTALIIYMMLR